MKTITIDYCGATGKGPTLAAAKQDACRKLAAAISGDYSPEIVAYREVVVLVARGPGGWDSRLIGDSTGIRGGTVHLSFGNYPDKKSALASARLHAAQQGWRREDGTEAPDFLDRASAGEFCHWAGFQLRYAEAKDRGMPDNDAYDYAGRNPARPELWLHEEKVA